MPSVSPDAGASTARRKGLLVLRSRGQASHRTPRPRARFQACAAAGLAARPCHRGGNVGALQCGRVQAFSLCGWQTGWRRPLSELRAPLPDGALRATKWKMGRGADYASWRAQQRGGRAPLFSLCGWQTGWRRPLSELRASLPDGALRAKKQNMDRGADYGVWRALQHAAAHAAK